MLQLAGLTSAICRLRSAFRAGMLASNHARQLIEARTISNSASPLRAPIRLSGVARGTTTLAQASAWEAILPTWESSHKPLAPKDPKLAE